jgi:hypothetical protein
VSHVKEQAPTREKKKRVKRAKEGEWKPTLGELHSAFFKPVERAPHAVEKDKPFPTRAKRAKEKEVFIEQKPLKSPSPREWTMETTYV